MRRTWQYNVKKIGYNAPPVTLPDELPVTRRNNVLRSNRLDVRFY